MIPWAWLSACSGGEDGPPPPGERVLNGPFVGHELVVDGDGLWVSAPGPDAPDDVLATWSRLVRPVAGGALADGAPTLVETDEDGLGGGLAVCADGSLVVGAPRRGDNGGAWFLSPDDREVGDQVFVEGLYDGGRAGLAVACGDLDGDALPDRVVAAPESDTVQPRAGTVAVYELEDGIPDKIANLDTTWSGAALGYRTGLVTPGDLDGDGIGDLLVAGPGSDRVHLVPGPVQGAYVANSAGPTFQGDDGEGTGTSLALGDLDGDGVLDLVLGTPDADAERGGIWVLPGPLGEGSAGLLRNRARYVAGPEPGSLGGFAVAVPGDVDGDGLDDLLVGAPGAGGAGPDAGAAYLILGSHLGSVATFDDADAILLPDAGLGRLGYAVAGSDLDGDGVFELYVAAPEADVDGVTGVGEVLVFPASVRGTAYADAASGRIRQ